MLNNLLFACINHAASYNYQNINNNNNNNNNENTLFKISHKLRILAIS